MAKNFKELRKTVRSDPKRRARVKEHKRAMLDALKLAEVRQAQELTQVEIADKLDVSQANISHIERQTDLYVSTLGSYVEALGGHLELIAVFPDSTVRLQTGGGRTRKGTRR